MKNARPPAKEVERLSFLTNLGARQLTIDEAKQRLTIRNLWALLDLPGEPKVSCKSPFREERKPSFSVSPDGLLFNDFTTGQGGDAIDFLQLAIGLSREAACRKFIEMAGGRTCEARPLPRRAPAAPQPRQRPNLPTMEPGTDEDLHRLATLRNVSFEACHIARCVGVLRFAELKGHRAWIVTDDEGLNAQARRLDGEPWAHIGGVKAYTLPGCWAGWPIGAKTGREYPAFMLVEGGPDLLAALHFIHREGFETTCFPVAMLGAKQRIHEDALPIFAGKRVRIFPHDDEPGREGGESWARQFEAVGAEVDCFAFSGLRKADGEPAKDLNDCTSIHPEDATELEGMLPQ